ncbi:MAG: DUF4159 domain-containing protein [Balneolaceae bacterium]|nr:DUF4159 domain-containing protein [Balneolaceae bacterium]
MIKKLLSLLLCFAFLWSMAAVSFAQSNGDITLARIKYRGGGDWYNDPSAFQNLIEFTNSQVPISISTEYDDVALGSRDLHKYPFVFLTGHGTISINQAEASNLREYLDNGGFLYVDDDYGLDDNFRKMLEQVYPSEELVELPFQHAIYHQVYDFPEGLPKVHEHDNKPPQGFAIFREGKMVAFYSYESNLADGWANPEVHNNPEPLRQKALQMGTNILVYALVSGR